MRNQARFEAWKGSLVLLFFCSTCLFSAPAARAEDGTATQASRKEEATRLFSAGEEAFREGDFLRAGEAFEEAYRIAPHPAPLWNAARSFERAGDDLRAANGYARYLREAPADAPDRGAALAAIVLLSNKLGVVEIYAKDASDVRLDDKPVEGDRVYVLPGTHVLEGVVDGKRVRQTEAIEAGQSRSMALLPAEKKAANATPPRPIVAPNAAHETTQARWLFPTLLATSAATTVSLGLLLWSGLDTLDARREFDADPTAEKLEDGKDKQLRTNVFVGASIGLGAATSGLFSYWLMRRAGDNKPKLGIAPIVPSPSEARASRFSLGFALMGSF